MIKITEAESLQRVRTLRNGENQWRLDIFEVVIVMRSDPVLYHEGVG